MSWKSTAGKSADRSGPDDRIGSPGGSAPSATRLGVPWESCARRVPHRACLTGSCDPGTGACEYEDTCAQPENPCYVAVCTAEGCDLEWVCDDGDDCTEDRCDPDAGGACTHVPKSGECDMSDCREGVCVDGACQTTPINEGGDCDDDGNPCTEGHCDGGACEETPKPDGAPCGGGRVCCNASCCASGTTCCGEWCYPEEYCCHDEFCMADCCDGVCCEGKGPCCNGICCPAGQECCAGQCWPYECCEGVPCQEGETCCGGGCCPTEVSDKSTAAVPRVCCGIQCCAEGEMCCGGTECCDPLFCCYETYCCDEQNQESH
jgi:hypothetical protein